MHEMQACARGSICWRLQQFKCLFQLMQQKATVKHVCRVCLPPASMQHSSDFDQVQPVSDIDGKTRLIVPS